MNVLVIAAHPDDEVLGCGGTIARLASEGYHMYIGILGEGITSRYQQRDKAEPADLQRLHTQSHEVARLLGARDLMLAQFPDNRFDTVPLLEIVKVIEGWIDRLHPQIIYTQHGGDLNIDHVQVYRATMTATRPMAGCSVKTIYGYEVASSTEWAFQQFSPVFRPNVFVDISAQLPLKIQTMQHYESEARLFPHPRSPEALRISAQRWGSVVGMEAAEAFELLRDLR
jgi:LmbE family N-acetylglucosaminyl deacetylase